METQALVSPSGVLSSRISVQTAGARRFIDLTDEVASRVRAAGFQAGLAVISSLHTTASIIINEHEPELLKDIDTFLARLAPANRNYNHNAVPCLPGEQPNGHSHCQSLLLQTSVTVPIIAGTLAVGRWQRIFIVELDCPRRREVAVTLLGA